MSTDEARVIAVRVGRPQGIPYRGKTVQSSIAKQPVEGAVMLRQLNLDGDEQADLSVHGGVDKAVYLYAEEDYAWWRSELERDIPEGIFGENLTVGGDWLGEVRIGDRFRIGDAIIAATEPREPCFKLGVQMNDQGFLKRFRDAGRTGVYARVVQEGEVRAGDAVVAVQPGHSANLTVAELHELYRSGRSDAEGLAAALKGPDLPESWRSWAEARLAEVKERE